MLIFNCACGGKYNKYCKPIHDKTKKHLIAGRLNLKDWVTSNM